MTFCTNIFFLIIRTASLYPVFRLSTNVTQFLQLTLEPDGMLRVSVLLVTPSVSLRMVFAVKGPGLSSVAEAYRKLVPFKSVSSIKTISV